jgi:uncharacterized protein (DUF849 family)
LIRTADNKIQGNVPSIYRRIREVIRKEAGTMAIQAISSGPQDAQAAQASHASAATKKATVHEAAVQTLKADKVTISREAAQRLESQQYSQKEEARETSTQKAKEAAQGKK